jgi:hypothetical protein
MTADECPCAPCALRRNPFGERAIERQRKLEGGTALTALRELEPIGIAVLESYADRVGMDAESLILDALRSMGWFQDEFAAAARIWGPPVQPEESA